MPAEGLSNFPLLVRISPAKIDGFAYWHSFENGDDFVFTAGEGGDALPYEIDTWDENGESAVWVRVPQLLPGMKIVCHCGKKGAHNASSDIWTAAGYTGVYHMNGETATADAANSAGDGANALGALSVVKGEWVDLSLVKFTGGPVGVARDTGHEKTTGRGNYFAIPADASFGSAAFTISGWFHLNSNADVDSPRVFSTKNDWSDGTGFEIEFNKTASELFCRGSDGSSKDVSIPDASAGWVHLVFVFNGTELTVYGNGSASQSGTQTIAAVQDSGRSLAVGNNASGIEKSIGGAVDEVRFMPSVASPAWIAESYRTAAASDYLSYAAEQDEAGFTEPVADGFALTGVDRVSATVGLTVRDMGGVESVQPVVKWGLSADALAGETSGAAIAQPGEASVAVGGFMPGRTYFAQLFLRTGAVDTPVSDIFTFTTGSEPPMPPLPEKCGLWQAKFSNLIDGASGWGKEGVIGTEDVLAVKEGDGEFERHRENGAVMAYQTGSYESPFSGLASSWANYYNFMYEGYMFLEAGAYVLRGFVDDYAYIEIDGEVIVKTVEYGDSGDKSWTCAATGWHHVRLGGGNNEQGAGIVNGIGLTYAYNGGEARWFLDAGDGSLFRVDLADAFAVNSLTRDGDSVTADLSFDEHLAGGTVSVVCGTSYCADEKADWTVARAEGIEANALRKLVTAENVVPSGDYIRIVVEKDGRAYWSRSYRASELAEQSQAQPMIDSLAVAAGGTDSATASINVLSLGGAASVTLKVSARIVGTDAANAVLFESAVSSTGVAAVELTGLRPGRDYVLTAIAYNGGETSEELGPVGFSTAADDDLSYEPLWQNGLWQAKFSNLIDGASGWGKEGVIGTEDVLAVKEGDGEFERHRENGAVMAYQTNGGAYVSEFSGISSSWGNLHNFMYDGYMFLEAGDYVFRGAFDDYAYIEIDGEVIAKTIIYGDSGNKPWTCATTGWHHVKLGTGDEGGGAGPLESVGLTYAYNGGEAQRFLDAGDGSLFRTAIPARNIEIVSYGVSADGAALTASLAFAQDARISSDETLYAVTGETRTQIGTVTAAETEKTVQVTLNGAGLVRFELEGADGGRSASRTITVPDFRSVQIGETAADFSAGNSASFSGLILSTGSADPAAVVVRLATSPDMADYAEHSVGSFAAGAPFALTVDGLEPGTSNYWQVVATGANGIQDATPVIGAWAEGAAVLAADVAAAESGFAGTFSGALERVGAGANATVTLWTGADANTLTNTQSIAVSEAGAFSFDWTFSFSNERVYYKFSVSNELDGLTWTSETAVASVDLVDTTDYVWTGAGGDGQWANPANWTPSDPRGRYPNSAHSTADFRSCSGATVVDLAETVYLKSLDLGAAVDVTLRKASEGRVEFHPESIATAEGLAFTIDGLYLPYNGLQYRKDMHFTVANGAEFETWWETDVHADGAILEVKGQSTYRHTDWVLSISGTGSKLIVDDSLIWAQNGAIWLSRNGEGRGNVMEVRGKHPRLFTRGVIVGRDGKSDVPPRIVFVVPEGGYDEAPFQWIQEDNGFCSNNNKGQTAEIVVDTASPAMLATRSSTVMLADWTNGGGTRIVKDNIDFSKQLRQNRVGFYYTYGADSSTEDDDNTPTGLWAKLDGRRATTVIIR